MPCDRGAVTVGNEVPIWRSRNPGHHNGIGDLSSKADLLMLIRC